MANALRGRQSRVNAILIFELTEQGLTMQVGKRRAIVRLRMPGAAAAAIRAGANLSPDRAVGRRTWEDFLATSTAVPERKSPVVT